MTTVAATRFQIAADRQLTHANGIIFKSGSKLISYNNPQFYPTKFVVGYAGSVDLCFKILDCFNTDNWKLPKKWESVEFLVLTEDHKLFTFSDPHKWYPVENDFYAMGSGSHFAMGALQTGLTAKEAVQVACKLDRNSGFGVSSISFN